MAPLWRQKYKDECKEVEARARSRAERKRDAAAFLNLTEKYAFDQWIPPWARKCDQGEKEEDEEAADGGITRSTRLIVAELQHLGVPATSDAADKIIRFHETLMDLSTCPSFKRAQIVPLLWSAHLIAPSISLASHHQRLTRPIMSRKR